MNVPAMTARFNPAGGYRIGGLAALTLHAGALLAVVHLASPTAPTPPAAPIMVSMIAAPAPAPLAKPEVVPKPLPVRQQALPTRQAPPLLAVANAAEAPGEAAPAPQAPPAPSIAEAPAPVAVTQPRFDADYLDNPPPAYPPLSRRMGEQGRVLLRVLVNADGSAAQVELKHSSGSSRLDQAALAAVRRWRFVPAKQGSQAIAAWVQVPISFTLGA